MPFGELKGRGPMGFRSTSVIRELPWEDTTPYTPPLVYVFAGKRRGASRHVPGRPENP